MREYNIAASGDGLGSLDFLCLRYRCFYNQNIGRSTRGQDTLSVTASLFNPACKFDLSPGTRSETRGLLAVFRGLQHEVLFCRADQEGMARPKADSSFLGCKP